MDHDRSQTSSEKLQDLAAKRGGMSPGMTSPDSTQVPLRSSDGEPDEEALRGRGTAGRSQDRTQGDEPVGDEGGR